MQHFARQDSNESQEVPQAVTSTSSFPIGISLFLGRPLLQYRDGLFQGHLTEYDKRHGKGVFLWNSGELYFGTLFHSFFTSFIFLGDWNHDHMEGEGIFYFALGGYVYGTFLEDKVHGYAILRFANEDYITGFWERGILVGKVVQYWRANDEWCLYEYKDGAPDRTLSRGKGIPPIRNSFALIISDKIV